jgi:hypothetical protein
LGILIFKGLTARRLYKSFGVKGLISADETGARGIRYKLPGPGNPDSGQSLDYFAYVFVRGVSKTFGEWYQKTNKTEDTNK